MDELLNYINRISLLEGHTSNMLKEIFVPETLSKGENFAEFGEVSKKMGFLVEGIVRSYYRNSEGTEYNKSFLKAPCFVAAYSSLITGKPNQYVKQALTDCRLLVADYSKFVLLYDFHPDLERASRKIAEMLYVEKERKEVEMAMLDADIRYEMFRKDYPQLEQLIPQYQIASYLGITPTQLSRIRKKLSGG